MKTFIRVAEIWVPDADGTLLEFGSGLYGNAPAFGAVSQAMCFGRGEGLPGHVWEERSPILLKDLQGGYFQRAAAARAAGLTCAVAFPVYAGDVLKAVVALFCGEAEGLSGAVEVWRNEPRVTSDLTLLDGIYDPADAAFEAASRETSLPRGAGLPGAAWQRQASVFIDGVSASTKFVRAQEAAETGIRHGLAFPCPVPGQVNFVLAFLSSPALPIARRIESWVPAEGNMLRRAQGHDEAGGPLAVEDHGLADVDAALREAFATGVPRTGANATIALPIFDDGAVAEVVTMAF